MNEKEWHEHFINRAEGVRDSFGTAMGPHLMMISVIEHLKDLWREKEQYQKQLIEVGRAMNRIDTSCDKEWDEPSYEL